MRRLVFLLALSLAATTSIAASQASIKQACSAKQDNKEAYASCIDTERKRAANTLRDLDPQIMEALNTETKVTGSTKRLDAYRSSQVRHVRQRNRTCKQQNDIERGICEGDMDNAQIRALQKYIKNN